MGRCSIGVAVGAGLVVDVGVVGLSCGRWCGGVVCRDRDCGCGWMVVAFSGLCVGVLVGLGDWSWAFGWCVCLVGIYSWEGCVCRCVVAVGFRFGRWVGGCGLGMLVLVLC